jgi:integrase
MRHVHKAHLRDRTVSPEEIRIFLNAVLTSNVRRPFKVVLRLVLMTMVRKSELMLARWSDVHFEEAEWHIPIENSKTGEAPHRVLVGSGHLPFSRA